MFSSLKFWSKKEEAKEASEEDAADDVDACSSSDDDDDEKPPPPVNLDDFAAVKRALDDAVIEVVLDRGYIEDGRLFGAKLGLGLAACAVALLAQFYPGKPPETSGLLAWCIIVYVVLTAATAAFSMAAEGDAFLVTRQPKSAKPSAASSPAAAAAVAKAAAKAEGLPLPPLRVSSNMARFEPEYELVLKSRAKSGEKASTSASSSTTVAVEARSHLKATSFFRTDGSLESNALKKDVCALLDEIEAKVAAAAKSGGGGASRGGPRSSPRTKRN